MLKYIRCLTSLDEVSMEYLKEHQEHNMEIEEDSLDLSRSTYSSRRLGEPPSPPKMKRLKTMEDNNHVLPSSSKSYANSDVGYESDTAEVIIHVYVIVSIALIRLRVKIWYDNHLTKNYRVLCNK